MCALVLLMATPADMTPVSGLGKIVSRMVIVTLDQSNERIKVEYFPPHPFHSLTTQSTAPSIKVGIVDGSSAPVSWRAYPSVVRTMFSLMPFFRKSFGSFFSTIFGCGRSKPPVKMRIRYLGVTIVTEGSASRKNFGHVCAGAVLAPSISPTTTADIACLN